MLFYKQRSKVIWTKEGDLSTKFFHSVLKSRKARNNYWWATGGRVPVSVLRGRLISEKLTIMVNWDFLEEMMVYLKFPRKYIAWIMMCVKSVSYSVNIDGESVGYFEGNAACAKEIRSLRSYLLLSWSIYLES